MTNNTHARERFLRGQLDAPALAIYFTVYLVLLFVSFALRITPEEPSLVWPPAGLYLISLALFRLKYWPAIIIASFAAELLTEVVWTGALDIPTTFIIRTINMLEAIAGGVIFAWLVPAPWYRRRSLDLVAYLVLGALLAPFVGAFLSAQVVQINTGSFSLAIAEFGAWWSGDFLGIMLVAPVWGAAVLQSTVAEPIKFSAYRASISVSLVVIIALVMLLGIESAVTMFPTPIRFGLAFLVLVMALSWLSVRQEPIIVASAAFAFTLTVSACLVTPDSLLRDVVGDSRGPIQALQLLLFACSLASFILSISLFESRYARRLLKLRMGAGELIATIVTRLSNFDAENVEAEIQSCLESVGRFAHADRCMILELDSRNTSWSQTNRWVRPGVRDTKALISGMPVEPYAGLIKDIRSGHSRFVQRNDYPTDHPLRQLYDKIGVRAALYSPVISGQSIQGAISLIWVRRNVKTPSEMVMVLQSLGQSIGRARRRVETERAGKRYRKRLRRLANELNRVDDNIRRETAIDLHDGAAQQLAVSRVKLAQLADSHPESAEALETIDQMVTDALTQIRHVIDRTAPTALYDLGLVPALEQFAIDTTRQIGVETSLQENWDDYQPTEEQSEIFYRAGREFVTNAIKHANASEVTIELQQCPDFVTIEVNDNGSGITSESAKDDGELGGGMGLFNLRETVKHLQGRMVIDSGTGGTRISISLPRTT